MREEDVEDVIYALTVSAGFEWRGSSTMETHWQ